MEYRIGTKRGRPGTEAALDRLPKREAVVSERDDADSQWPLAGCEAIGEAQEQAEVEDKPKSPENLKGHFPAEPDLHPPAPAGGVVEVFADVKLLLDEVLEARLHRGVGEGEDERGDGNRKEAAPERGEGCAGKRLGAVAFMGIEKAGRLLEGHRATIVVVAAIRGVSSEAPASERGWG